MNEKTRKTITAFVQGAIEDPKERQAALAALQPKVERRDKLLTGAEAARMAGVARKTIRDWEKKGLIRGRHITRSRVRFSRNELEAFLCEVEGGAE